MDIVYLDLLFITNFILDYLILLCSGICCRAKIRRMRVMISSLTGALYACVSLVGAQPWVTTPVVQLSVAILLCLIAYGAEPHLVPLCICFVLLSAAIGGIFTALSVTRNHIIFAQFHSKTAILVFSLVYFISHLIARYLKHGQSRIHRATVTMLGKTIGFPAMLDTGNELFDPITGKRILVCDYHVLNMLFPNLDHTKDTGEAADVIGMFDETEILRGGIHYIPFRSLGGNGTLVGMKADLIKIDDRPTDLLIAFTDIELSKTHTYYAIY